MVHCCCAYGCTSRFKKGVGLGFFRFPKKKSRLISWLLALRRKNFVPSRDVRICGKHFITGRPSLNRDHPDYVPTIFSFQKGKSKKYGTRQKEFCEAKELSFLNYTIEDDKNEETESANEDEGDFRIETEPDIIPELYSPLINVETVKRIARFTTSNSYNPSSDSRSKNSKTLYTFIDTSGQIIGRFSQQPLKKIPKSNPVETVQVILNKKKAQTAAVDKRTLCPAKDKESCKCYSINGNCDVTGINDNDFYPIEVKIEQNIDNEDMVGLFTELRDLEYQKKELESKIQDKLLKQES